jgi:DNA-binding MarR family transcriptional regulator
VPELQPRLSRPAYDGLTVREASVLDTVVRLGGASRDLLAARIGLPPSELTQALTRLEALGYATMTHEGGGTYRAVAQLGG